jgi:hypothetical protein
MTEQQADKGPLPIWFFVGVILAVYGLLVLCAGLLGEMPERVVKVTDMSPAIWWGGVMIFAGIILFAIGVRGRRA